ncbi:hypothetical protein HMPREF2852_06615 [Anaerococcus sp. HMSC065G05]|uniref:hypothetical protein n=1 Tax=Anaerococcus sp. HMSC065G05 TaxID=1739356 RepID=UPI0008A24EB4|nr:hypothetical protein [Anaerococcus sp. HMSC065G05]OFJ69700.1 hypothetical protein HMPREF2852_06615 [Anaerococcus sp. HMSC065G05]
MERLYFIVTADELEFPIAVGRTIKELAMDSGKPEITIYSKMRSQKKSKCIKKYKIEVVEVEK